MTLRGSKHFGLAGLACLVAALAAACSGGVTNSGNGSSGDPGECEDPPPPSGGWCPPAWSCVDGQWIDTAGACPSPCPVERPYEGEPCDAVGAQCTYEEYWDEPCGEGGYTETLEVTCTEQGWSTPVFKCQPEPVCPDELPVAGTDCSGWYDAWYCTYTVETSCGAAFGDAWCDGVTWQVSVQNECGACSALTSAASCEGAEGCAWLTPGCGEPAVVEGCYPAEPCTEGSCGEYEACLTVSYNPCWNDVCDACAAETNVCVPFN